MTQRDPRGSEIGVARCVLYSRAYEYLEKATTYGELVVKAAAAARERLARYVVKRPAAPGDKELDDMFFNDYAVKGVIRLLLAGGEPCDAVTRKADIAAVAADIDVLNARAAVREAMDGVEAAHKLLSYALLPIMIDLHKKPRKVVIFAADMNADDNAKVNL